MHFFDMSSLLLVGLARKVYASICVDMCMMLSHKQWASFSFTSNVLHKIFDILWSNLTCYDIKQSWAWRAYIYIYRYEWKMPFSTTKQILIESNNHAETELSIWFHVQRSLENRFDDKFIAFMNSLSIEHLDDVCFFIEISFVRRRISSIIDIYIEWECMYCSIVALAEDIQSWQYFVCVLK